MIICSLARKITRNTGRDLTIYDLCFISDSIFFHFIRHVCMKCLKTGIEGNIGCFFEIASLVAVSF